MMTECERAIVPFLQPCTAVTFEKGMVMVLDGIVGHAMKVKRIFFTESCIFTVDGACGNLVAHRLNEILTGFVDVTAACSCACLNLFFESSEKALHIFREARGIATEEPEEHEENVLQGHRFVE